MKILLKAICIITIFTFLGCGEDSTLGPVEFGKIKGRVVKAKSFEPISNAKVTLSPTNNSTFTDDNGEFLFEEVAVNQYSVQAEKEGFLDKFEPADLQSGATLSINFEMQISTALNKPPSVPEIVSPDDGVTDLDNSVEIVWRQSKDPEEDEIKYKIELRNDFNNDVLKIENLTDTTYTVNNLKFGAKYFWHIAVSDDINPEVQTNVRAFTIKTDPENRYFYVRKENGNNIIYSGDLDVNGNLINEVKLTDSSKNSWRPRKNNPVNLVAFLGTFNNETHIFTMEPNGEDVKRVTTTVPVTAFNLNQVDFSWSTNGEKLIYPHHDKLYMINKDGSGLQLIHQTTNGHLITECEWSNDGTKIALVTNNSSGYDGFIYTIDVNGNLVDTIVSNNVGALGGLNISVDGMRLLFTRDVSNFQSVNYRRLDNVMFLYDFQTSTISQASNGKESGTNDLDPRFSPNEAEVIFVNTSNDGISVKTIYKMELNSTSAAKEEVVENATMPDWE
ncbi:hypothetical protein WH52_07300 [Tenacibaculum holothuriorum]|uniref:Fibronectin type-III domain-containing protein n=1 Tax=Tenacibaculum holothuriorum TaxID=1635173 RepID=A0A1Y2PDN2_9FLAO|nr:carboxypeptidase regulatory-like domain-containing protein [Tenacibaculum holothuriorum]OSY88545.1 hypothetical protein WH52_07300 [Tenacibaculum holothuriorum]